MESRWDEGDASRFEDDDLALRVYTSRLLGQEEALVLHGGGNTSVKSVYQDFFDRPVPVLYVKGSGWDLKTIEKPGFAPLRLEETRLLAERESLCDDDMAAQLRNLLLDQTAPAPPAGSAGPPAAGCTRMAPWSSASTSIRPSWIGSTEPGSSVAPPISRTTRR
jgi:rhamnose utilization protein RhaD (predicted bifunctional aldolase and dehydrogenase)